MKGMVSEVLLVLEFIRPEIGYFQGMNFIVGALIYFLDKVRLLDVFSFH